MKKKANAHSTFSLRQLYAASLLAVFFSILFLFLTACVSRNRFPNAVYRLPDGEADQGYVEPASQSGQGGSWFFHSTGEDSKWFLRDINQNVRLIRLEVLQIPETTDVNPSQCAVFYNAGSGIVYRDAAWAFLHEGNNYIQIGSRNPIQDLRIDFTGRDGDTLLVGEIELNPRLSLSGTGFAMFFALLSAAVLFLLLPALDSRTEQRICFHVTYIATAWALIILSYFACVRMACAGTSIYDLLPGMATAVCLFFLSAALSRHGRDREKRFIVSLLAACFCLYFTWALLTPYNGGPDESMRYRVVEYIFRNHTIPRGDDPAAISPAWGFSYSYYPCLSYVISALFQLPVSIFTKDAFCLLMAARMTGILSCLLTVYFSSLAAKALFPHHPARFGIPVLTGFLPQFAFTAVYVNNNAFAIMTGSMLICCWIYGDRNRWRRRDCVCLAAGVGLCALSYYVSYGYILLSVLFFLYSARRNRFSKNETAHRFLFISLLTLLICGWWFVRNAILYHGDFLGFASAHRTAALYGDPALVSTDNPSPMEAGESILHMLFVRGWFRSSYLSFLGNFFWMNLPLRRMLYRMYTLLFLAGAVGTAPWILQARNLKNRSIHSFLGFAAIFPVLISALFSYISDYQAQGRYLLPGLVPLAFFLVPGFSCAFRPLYRLALRFWNRPVIRKAERPGKTTFLPASTAKADSLGTWIFCIAMVWLCLSAFCGTILPFYC